MVLVGVAGTPPSIADGQQLVADTKVDFTQ